MEEQTKRDTPLPADAERRVQVHDEACTTIRWTFITIVVSSIFCLITLSGTPDSEMLKADQEIKLPALDFSVNFQDFLIFVPVLLTVLLIYMHVYIEFLRLFDISKDKRKPIIFNLPVRSAIFLSPLILYWMIPTVLALFVWKAWPWAELGSPLAAFALAVTAAMLLLHGVRSFKDFKKPAAFAVTAVNVLFLAAVLAVFYAKIGDRNFNLVNANLSNADLRAFPLRGARMLGINLSNANLTGLDLTAQDLHRAVFKGANMGLATFDDANLSEADLTSANMVKARFVNAKLPNAKAKGGDLRFSDFRCADLRKAVLNEADLNEANLTDVEAEGVQLVSANLTSAQLANANLAEANLSDATLTAAKLRSTYLSKAILERAVLEDSNEIIGTYLTYAAISHASFEGSTLVGVDFLNSVLKGVNFEQSTLLDVNFSGTVLHGANFKDAVFDRVNLAGADLTNATGLTPEHLEKAVCDVGTILPSSLEGLSIAKCNGDPISEAIPKPKRQCPINVQ